MSLRKRLNTFYRLTRRHGREREIESWVYQDNLLSSRCLREKLGSQTLQGVRDWS
jgi:hypothetical protein